MSDERLKAALWDRSGIKEQVAMLFRRFYDAVSASSTGVVVNNEDRLLVSEDIASTGPVKVPGDKSPPAFFPGPEKNAFFFSLPEAIVCLVDCRLGLFA